MGKGRAPCCDKTKVKRGPWSPAEDMRLVAFIQKHGHDNWRALPKQAGLLRCGKSCRLRWINYLRPDVKRGNFTKEEEETIIKLHQTLGNKWSKIASYLSGRTDNEIKNVWNTHLKKRLATYKDSNIPDGDDSKESSVTTATSSSASVISSRELDLDFEIDQQWNRDLEPKKIQTSETTIGNSEGESATKRFSSPVMSEPYDVLNTLDEVNKPYQIEDNSMEIPLESDFDFWNMLDSLSTFQSNNKGGEDQIEHDRSLKEGCINGEVENKKWLRELETELGLELDNTKDEIQEKLSEDYVVSESFHQYEDVPFRPETEIGHYHLWPSL